MLHSARCAGLALTLLLATTPALAQSPTPAEEMADQRMGTDKLNQQALAKVQGSNRVDQRENQAYAEALLARESKMRADREAYDRQMAEYRAKVAAQQAENRRRRAEWQAAVAACKAGDLSKCAKE